MRAKELIDELQKKLSTNSNSELASSLGITAQTLASWTKNKRALTPRQVASALAKAQRAAVRKSQLQTIKPLAEFYPIERCLSKQEKSYRLFPTSKDGATSYARGLKEALSSCKGIYIFYDSQGKALYAGKAHQRSLWVEMNDVFNRARVVQKIYLVNHPDRNQKFESVHEKQRQPRLTQLELADLAHYFSAFEIGTGMIGNLEALLVRSFANDLLNARIEKFSAIERA